MLTLDDGVIVTGYEGNHLIEGRAYEFPFWWCDLRRIHDVPSMAEFCRRCHIRYWLVDHSATMSRILCGREQIAAHYWTDARLVTARGTTAVYDVTGPSLKLVKSASADLTGGAVAVTGREGIGYDLRPQSPGGMCRVKLDLSSDGNTGPLLEIVWRDAQGNVAGRTSVAAQGKSDYAACVYSPVPPGARAAGSRSASRRLAAAPASRRGDLGHGGRDGPAAGIPRPSGHGGPPRAVKCS